MTPLHRARLFIAVFALPLTLVAAAPPTAAQTPPAASVIDPAAAAAPPAAAPAAATPSAQAAEFDRISAERDPLITLFNEQYTAQKSAEALATREKVIPLERRTLELTEARFPGDKESRRILAERLYDSLQYVAHEKSKLNKFAESETNWTDAETLAAAEFGADDWRVRECRARKDTTKAVAALPKDRLDAYVAGQAAMIETVALLNQNKVDEAAKVGEQALDLMKKSMGDAHYDVGTCLNNLAMIRGRQKKPDDAAKLFLQSEQILRKALGDHPSTARTLANYGSAIVNAGNYQLAEPLVRAGYEMRLATLGPDNGPTADSAFGLGVVLFNLGQPREAIPLLSQNLDYIRAAGGENTPQAAAALQYIGRALMQLGETDDAVKCLEKTVEINRASHGEEHADTLISLVNLSEAYTQANDYLKSSACLEQAAAIGRKILDPNHQFLGRVMNDLGVAYLRMKSFSKALPNLEEGLAIRKKAFGEEHDLVRVSLHNLGVANRDKGNYAEGEALLKQALAVAEKVGEHDSIAAGDAAFALGGLYAAQGKVDEAEKSYLDALARIQKANSPVAVLGVRHELATLYEANSRFPAARDQLELLHALCLEIRGPSDQGTQNVAKRLAAAYEKTGDKDKLDKLMASARGAAGESTSANNLKQLGLAMFNYHDAKGAFPAAGSTKVDGAPRLSWRVHILPYLEQLELYKKFKLDEPWDSEHNRALIAEMPAVFQTSGVEVGPGKTLYLAVAGPDSLFGDGAKGPNMRDVTDGMSNTVMLVEVDPDQAVEWTKPADWEFDATKPLAGVGKLRNGMFLTLFADGAYKKLEAKGLAEKFKAFVTPRGGEVVEMIE